MRSSLKLFTWFGIPVHLHWTFGLIFLYAFYIGGAEGGGWIGILLTIGLFVSLFGCVLLHEFGHSLTARRYGVQTQDIILTPIGGIARLERMPEKPIQEFLVAIMGPMVNVVIALLLLLIGRLVYTGVEWNYFIATIYDYFSPVLHFFGDLIDVLLGQLEPSDFYARFEEGWPSTEAQNIAIEGELNVGSLLLLMPILLSVNLMLVLFNMIPAFPMDGGRVFRALLAMRLGRVSATKWASRVGQFIALLFVLFGLLKGGIMLVLIGFFVFSMARTENNMVQLSDFLSRFQAKDILRTHFTRLNFNDWMQTPIDLLRSGLERHFLVFDMDDQLMGALTEDRIAEAAKSGNTSSTVADYMQRVRAVHLQDSMGYIYQLLMQEGEPILAVVDEYGLKGVIDREGFRNFMRLNGI
ncbi:MAG: site-2 protease family protein [Bacteroidetes bacterium]|nr:site-2 protease family protein [Bacteroidota bacterium]